MGKVHEDRTYRKIGKNQPHFFLQNRIISSPKEFLRNFYPIVTKFGTLKVRVEDELCGSHKSGNTSLTNFKNLIKVVITVRLSTSSQNVGHMGPIVLAILSLKIL